MNALRVAVLFAAISVSVLAAGNYDYYLYRAAGPVPFDSQGIPVMTMSVTTTPKVNDPTTVYMGKAQYNNSEFEMGWDQLNVAPDRTLFLANETSLQAWYTAGYAEGYATMTSIQNVLIAQAYNYSAAGQIWVDKHMDFILSNVRTNNNAFWTQVRKQLTQIQGMVDGFNARALALGVATRTSFFLIYQANLANEYGDIGVAAQDLYGNGDAKDVAIDARFRVSKNGPKTVPQTSGHCSALVKATDSDLFISHVTWASFTTFVGTQYKTYFMESTVSMSSNAGLINSGGDWYQTSSKLSVIETTNEFTNNNLYPLITPQCVSEFMRVMVANYLATSGQQWTELFATYPSGTYCNQWMIIDYKLYTKGSNASTFPDGLFWILEEIPGMDVAQDMTWFLRENTYWASYNIPYFPAIYEASGFGVSATAYGEFFTWSMAPRAQIFRRDNHKIVDLPSMQRMMRYNDWQVDPLSAIQGCTGCNPTNSPMLAISSRGDLVPQNATFGNLNSNYAQDFGFSFFGGANCKISSYDMISNSLSASFINGPTHDTQPVFTWAVAPTNPVALLPGMPQIFDFEWETVAPAFTIPAPIAQSVYRNITVDVYRRNTTISFDPNGVPQMRIVAGYRGSINVDDSMILLATAVYNESGLVTGFDQLAVNTTQTLFESDDTTAQAWYAAGLAEGYATAEAIEVINYWRNYTYTANTDAWVQTHIAYMRENSNTKFTPFWKQVRRQLIQMQGIADGVNLRNQQVDATYTPMTFLDVFMINFRDDNDDVITIVTAPKEEREAMLRARDPHTGDHCSALIKVTQDDLIMSQATWAGYGIMIHKQIKTYVLGTTVTMSCNAGMIFSGDDWYQTSNFLGVQETTNEFKNVTLYDLVKPQCVSEFMRVMVATYLATTSQQWVQYYSTEPSGTYCNQWMVIDFKKFGPSVNQSNLPDGTFWLAEEIPGLIQSQDMTWFLRENGYWASYNIPYFPEIALISGFIDYERRYGDFYSWSRTPRAQIFRRDNNKVVNVETMRDMMRYNDWQNDPLSAIPNCTGCVPANSPICTISSRGDLVPLDATFGDLSSNFSGEFTFGYWGSPDAKISSYKMINDGFLSYNTLSPTYDQQPVFNWNAFPDYVMAAAPGMVQSYEFTSQFMQPAVPVPPPSDVAVGERFYVYRTSGDGVPAPTTSIPNITFTVTADYEGSDGLIATVQYNRTSAQIGWDQITVTANPTLFATGHYLQAWYGAGIAEGFATFQSIKDVIAVQNYTLDAAAETFVEQQLAWLRSNAEDQSNLVQAYWRQVRKQLLQMEGIAAGFNLRALENGDSSRVSILDVFRINLYDEKGDIISATNPSVRGKKNYAEGLHCSAIVKVTPFDLLFGHDMWTGYYLLVGRQYKTYEMEITVSMSSNAMYIASGDDWYIMSTNLGSMETTNDFFNTALYDLIVPQSTPEFMRVMIANYVATNGQEWTELFGQNHSGTYCNQYMVLDFNLYRPGQNASTLDNNTLWVVEELPGMVRSGDETEVLRQNGYWASYNIPYFKDIFELSGYAAKRQQYGTFFDHDLTPRAEIFRQRQGPIKSYTDLYYLMRYNDWQNDPLSTIPNCTGCVPANSPMLGIASRGDLVPTNNYMTVVDTFYANYFENAAFGAVDCKIGSAMLTTYYGFAAYVELGPTHVTQPTFSWSNYTATVNSISTASGMIQTWDFGPTYLVALDTTPPPYTPGPSDDSDGDKTTKIIIGCVVAGIVALVMIGSVAYCFLSKVEKKNPDGGGEYDRLQ